MHAAPCRSAAPRTGCQPPRVGIALGTSQDEPDVRWWYNEVVGRVNQNNAAPATIYRSPIGRFYAHRRLPNQGDKLINQHKSCPGRRRQRRRKRFEYNAFRNSIRCVASQCHAHSLRTQVQLLQVPSQATLGTSSWPDIRRVETNLLEIN